MIDRLKISGIDSTTGMIRMEDNSLCSIRELKNLIKNREDAIDEALMHLMNEDLYRVVEEIEQKYELRQN